MERKYSKRDRLSIARQLQRALPLLWDGVSSPDGKRIHICLALMQVNPRASLAREVIMGRLGPVYRSVSKWLDNQGYFDSINPAEWNCNVQAYRKRWMEALIAEFSQ